MTKRKKTEGLGYDDLFICGLCRKRVGGGRVSLVTHAVFFHDWQIKLVQEKAVYKGKR